MKEPLLKNSTLDDRLKFLIKEVNSDHSLDHVINLNKIIEAQTNKIIELEQSEKKLLELGKFKDRMFSIIAHDIRSPISNIKTFLSFMSQDDDITLEELKRTIQSFEKQIDYSLEITDNLLKWSYSQSNTTKLNIEKINLHSLVNAITPPIKLRFQNKNLNINNEIPVDVEIEIDKDIVSTVIRNLLWNAGKFTNKNGLVRILYKQISDEEFSISVIDNGIGMSKEEMNSIINREKINSKKGTNDEKGVGLGLLLCKDLLEIHNAELLIKSEVNKGSEFKILFH